MRLANVTAFELARPLPDPQEADCECRIVAYVPEQERPVYISEARQAHVVDGRAITKFSRISFGDSPLRRSFRLALQLWVNTDAWTLADGCVVDLRHMRRAPSAGHEHLVIHTDAGPMVPAIPMEETQPRAAKSRRGSETSGLDAKPAGPARSFRLFGWGSSSAEDAASKPASATEPGPLVSLSYTTLVDLWTLQHSLDDARAASSAVAAQINDLIPESSLPLKDKESVLARRLAAVRKQTRLARDKAQQAQEQARQRRESDAHRDGLLQESARSAQAIDTQMRAAPRRDAAEDVPAVAKEQSRLASQLLEIFPIDPVEDAKFHFTIRGLALPSVFAINHYDPVQVGAALGFVAQVVVLLSRYLDVALPYPITVYGSQSFIADNISSIRHGSNKFPLWTRGALLYRVEYALYLLHKDIEQLMNAMDLAVADLKQTLANLKNLLLVVSHS